MSITSEYDVTIDLSETDTKNYKDENFIQKQAKKSFFYFTSTIFFVSENSLVTSS